jgi:Zn-dependent peptidase ImmA (M78 family)
VDDDLRMKLADLGSPEALADCIVNHFDDMEIPIPLPRVAAAVGIQEIIGQQTDSFEGVLITNAAKTSGSIAYNENSRPERRRFTIAHELGHFLMPLHGANAQCVKADMGVLTAKDTNRAREAEANRFAAALLMPKPLFLRDMRRLGEPEIEHVVTLADTYEVSKEAAVHRYTKLSDDPCAIIFSKNGSVGHVYRASNFPFITLQQDQPLPRQCLSAQGQYEPGRISECCETTTELWVAEDPRLRRVTLYEQFLDQANGYRMTMLTVDGALDDDPDEEDELNERWTPRFR